MATNLSKEKKDALRKLLRRISDDAEQQKLTAIERADILFEALELADSERDAKFERLMQSVVTSLAGLQGAFGNGFTRLLEASGQRTTSTGESNQLLRELLGSHKAQLGLPRGDTNHVPMMEKIVQGLADSHETLKNVHGSLSRWRWPQYMATSVRNKNYAQINPAQDTIATTIGVGNGSVATSGVAVQLSASSVPCTRVIIYCNDANASLTNTGIIVVGDSSVVAAQATRKGAAVYPANSIELRVSNLNMVYLDATDNAAKYHYYYENVV